MRRRAQLASWVAADASSRQQFEADPAGTAARFGVEDVGGDIPSPSGPVWASANQTAPGTTVGASTIHGNGLYAETTLGPGTTLDSMYTGSMLDEAHPVMSGTAGMMNASRSPNAHVEMVGGQPMVRTTGEVHAGEELTMDYTSMLPDLGSSVVHGFEEK